MDKFIGRVYELKLIREQLQKPSAAVMIYGKRKVGKTTLINYALKGSSDTVVYYECLKSTMQDNVNGFVRELVSSGILPAAFMFGSFTDVFAYLNSLNKEINVVIDEYPYLKEMAPSKAVDSQFQSIIDSHIGNIRLFLSGSHIGMMKDLLNESNALYGRFSLTIQLRELNYVEASAFYPEKSSYDKIALYSVFGGSPFINRFIDSSKGLKENIINTILNQFSPVSNYAEYLLVSDYSRIINAERILHAIANGKKRYGEMEEMLGMKNNGLLSKQMASLISMDIITKNFPVNRPDDKKKTYYEISDNLLRFYYAFIYRNRSALEILGPEAFYDEYISAPIITFISHRFEEICRSYFSIQVRTGMLHGVSNIGTYWFDDAATKTNGEFDVVLERRKCYDIYEVKYYSTPMTAETMKTEAEKIRNIKGISVNGIGFISASGFECGCSAYNLITGDMLYKT